MKTTVANTIPAAKLTLPIAGRDHIQGPIDAPVALVEYGDYECPFCGEVYPVVKAIQQRLGDSLCFAYRNFPLANMHPHSFRAAEAAEAAGAQGKFWEMHDLLYEHQNDWKDQFDVRPIFENYAKQAGVDVERYKRDLEGDLVAQRIFQDGRRAHSLGVGGTPTVFINDREVPFENLAADKLRLVIQKELQAVKTSSK